MYIKDRGWTLFGVLYSIIKAQSSVVQYKGSDGTDWFYHIQAVSLFAIYWFIEQTQSLNNIVNLNRNAW